MSPVSPVSAGSLLADPDRRVCCVWLPRFGLSVARRLDSSLLTQESARDLMALYRPGTRWQELLECSPALEAAGILPGLPLREAQARVPDAVYLPCNDALLDALEPAFERVCEALDAFSPIVEAPSRERLADARAAAYLDVAGLAPLYGPEPGLAERLVRAATDAGECEARAGIASGKFTAWVAANLAQRFGDAPDSSRSMVVPPGEEALFLAPLPLETLPLAVGPRKALERLGVRTLGAYAALPANSVAHRYGQEGARAHLLARGIDDSPLRLRRLPPAVSVGLAFDWEESELDRLTYALGTLAEQLAARLEGLGAADALRVTWRLSTGEEREALLRLAEPASTTSAFKDHLRWHAEGLEHFLAPAPPDSPPSSEEEEEPPFAETLSYEPMQEWAGVKAITLEAVGVQPPAGRQLRLLASPMRFGGAASGGSERARQAARAVARLQARWGPGAVRQAVLTPARVPEATFQLVDPTIDLQLGASIFAPPSTSAKLKRQSPKTSSPQPSGPSIQHPATQHSALALWLLHAPEPVSILTPRKGGRRVLSRPAMPPGGEARAFGGGKRQQRIVQWGGPWKVVDPTGLVGADPLRRDYYQLETEDGSACLVYWDRASDAWFLQGIFD